MLVYLFELDSVINEEKLIKTGQLALFEEIFINGNTVVLTINQLTDSACIFNLINDNETYQIILDLFNRGLLKINLFENITSVSQYVQNAIENNNANTSDHIFSNLPVNKDNKTLLEAIKKSLRYSDLTYINNGFKDDENVEFVKKYIKLVLQLSLEEKPKLFPKDSAIKKLDFHTIYQKIDTLLQSNASGLRNLVSFTDFERSWHLIGQQGKDIKKKEKDIKLWSKRSVWYKYIARLNVDILAKNCCYEIIDLFYNYTVEDSIDGISYHYDKSKDESFFADFLCRFENMYLLIDLSKQREVDIENVVTIENEKLNWLGMQRFLKYEKVETQYYSKIYEQEIKQSQKNVLKRIFGRTIKNMLFFTFHVSIFVVAQFILGKIELDSMMKVLNINYLKVILDIILLGILATVTSKIFKIPDIFDSLKNIYITVYDLFSFLSFKISMRNGYSYKRGI